MPRVASVERLFPVEEDLVHQPVDASADEEIELCCMQAVVPDFTRLGEVGGDVI